MKLRFFFREEPETFNVTLCKQCMKKNIHALKRIFGILYNLKYVLQQIKLYEN